jgi:hypothetical protein
MDWQKKPPVVYRHKPFVEDHYTSAEQLRNARLELCYRLMNGELQAQGINCVIEEAYTRVPVEEYYTSQLYYKVIDTNNGNPQLIRGSQWSFDSIQWEEELLIDEGSRFLSPEQFKGWQSITINTKDLMKSFPHAVRDSIQIDEAGDYTPPFLTLMHQAIEHFQITASNQVGTKLLIPWFEEKLKGLGELATNNKAKMMATFVRNPESQKGGNTKSKRDP